MKKIIIVGHNQENNEKLETLFQHFGMKKALPSRREGLTPIQVGELLSKAIKSQAPQIQEIDEEELPKKLPTHISKRRLKKNLKKQQNTQVASALPKSMWDYIPMDLMIANIDNEFWGWADKNALENLEYWKNLDPSIYFVLTYDQPQSLLHKLESENEEISKEIILEKLDDWNAYNTKMLDFFEKNPERAILINNERVKQQNNSSIKALYSQVVPNEFNHQEIVSFEELSIDQTASESPISSVLVNTIIHNSPEISETFSKLNQQANFPSVEYYNSDIDSVIDAWRENKSKSKTIRKQEIEIKERDNILKTTLTENKEKDIKIQNLIDENKETSSKNENLRSQLKTSEVKLSNLETKNNELTKNYQESLDEKNVVNEQLNIVLQQLEKVSLEKKSIEKAHYKSEEDRKNAILSNEKKEKELIQEKNKLLKENEKATSENQELLFQLHLVQEELEKVFLENKRLKETPPLWGAANRIRNQLTYRIGHTLVKKGTTITGWLFMPFTLMNVYFEYRKEYKRNQWNKLPSIDNYQDAYEAEKIKKHLSYKLGKIFLKDIKNPVNWFALPFKLVKEQKNHKNNK